MTTRAGLRAWLGVSDGRISEWGKIGFPKSVKGKYDKMKIALWLEMTPKVSKAVKIIAKKFLAERQAKKSEPEEKMPAQKLKLGKTGIKEAVERARLEEVKAHARYEEARNANRYDAGTMLEEWQKSCDFLAKSEPVLLKFLKDSAELSPAVEFEKFMEKKFQAVKSAFLALPQRVAPALEAKEWPEIQKILEAEIGAAFDSLSRK